MKKILGIVCVIALVGVIGVWMPVNPGPEHIEDTNGADNLTYTTDVPSG